MWLYSSDRLSNPCTQFVESVAINIGIADSILRVSKVDPPAGHSIHTEN